MKAIQLIIVAFALYGHVVYGRASQLVIIKPIIATDRPPIDVASPYWGEAKIKELSGINCVNQVSWYTPPEQFIVSIGNNALITMYLTSASSNFMATIENYSSNQDSVLGKNEIYATSRALEKLKIKPTDLPVSVKRARKLMVPNKNTSAVEYMFEPVTISKIIQDKFFAYEDLSSIQLIKINPAAINQPDAVPPTVVLSLDQYTGPCKANINSIISRMNSNSNGVKFVVTAL